MERTGRSTGASAAERISVCTRPIGSTCNAGLNLALVYLEIALAIDVRFWRDKKGILRRLREKFCPEMLDVSFAFF